MNPLTLKDEPTDVPMMGKNDGILPSVSRIGSTRRADLAAFTTIMLFRGSFGVPLPDMSAPPPESALVGLTGRALPAAADGRGLVSYRTVPGTQGTDSHIMSTVPANEHTHVDSMQSDIG